MLQRVDIFSLLSLIQHPIWRFHTPSPGLFLTSSVLVVFSYRPPRGSQAAAIFSFPPRSLSSIHAVPTQEVCKGPSFCPFTSAGLRLMMTLLRHGTSIGWVATCAEGRSPLGFYISKYPPACPLTDLAFPYSGGGTPGFAFDSCLLRATPFYLGKHLNFGSALPLSFSTILSPVSYGSCEEKGALKPFPILRVCFRFFRPPPPTAERA